MEILYYWCTQSSWFDLKQIRTFAGCWQFLVTPISVSISMFLFKVLWMEPNAPNDEEDYSSTHGSQTCNVSVEFCISVSFLSHFRNKIFIFGTSNIIMIAISVHLINHNNSRHCIVIIMIIIYIFIQSLITSFARQMNIILGKLFKLFFIGCEQN